MGPFDRSQLCIAPCGDCNPNWNSVHLLLFFPSPLLGCTTGLMIFPLMIIDFSRTISTPAMGRDILPGSTVVWCLSVFLKAVQAVWDTGSTTAATWDMWHWDGTGMGIYYELDYHRFYITFSFRSWISSNFLSALNLVFFHQCSCPASSFLLLPLYSSLHFLSWLKVPLSKSVTVSQVFPSGQQTANFSPVLSGVTSVFGDATSGAASIFGDATSDAASIFESATSIAPGVFETVTCVYLFLFP